VPQPSATPDAALPLDTATGIAAVDHLLRLLAANDFNAVSAEAVFPDKPCTHATTGISGQPACEPGIAEGTLVPAQLFGSCEPNFIGPDSRQLITERLSTIFLQSRIRLDSVWKTDPIESAYAVVVAFSNSTPGASGTIVIYIDDAGHLAGNTVCGGYDAPAGNAIKVFPS
jgi:hypothetical protein